MTASPNDKDGGAIPAFPSPPIPGATDHRSEQRDGLSLRDYFAAKAPAPMSWFKPVLPTRPEDDWRVGERRCTNYNYALVWANKHGGVATNENADAQIKWSNESNLIAHCQWAYMWADFMLSARLQTQEEGK